MSRHARRSKERLARHRRGSQAASKIAAFTVVALAHSAILLLSWTGCGGAQPSGTSSTNASPSNASVAQGANATSGERDATGRVRCGDDTCEAGREVCCTPDDGGEPSCEAARVDGSWDSLASAWEACGYRDFAACDDAADCGANQACCRADERMPDDYFVVHQSCVPVDGDRAVCAFDEVCSDASSLCHRKGATCIDSVCHVPHRRAPSCGEQACEQAEDCVETEGARRCVARSERTPDAGSLIECDRGSDCPVDEFCYASPRGQVCRTRPQSGGRLDRPICYTDDDCQACGARGIATCVGATLDGKELGTCACAATCAKDDDCADYCNERGAEQGLGIGTLVGTCDPQRQACSCAEY